MEKVGTDHLRKKARKKFLSNSLAAGLVRVPSSPLNSQYAKTFACCETLGVNDRGDLTTKFYCKNRWCQTCASIKMATMINKYFPAFESLPDLYFVTLTMRSVRAFEISDRMDLMQKNWRNIADRARKKCVDFIGLRKTELKIGKGGGYHGHYHIIVSGEANADFIISHWLRLAGDLANRSAQDMRPVRDTEAALLELFKYATKCTAADNGGNEILATFTEMDTIFRAIYGKRVFQPFGGMKAVNEDDFELTAEVVQRAAGIYNWIGHDWYHEQYGQALSGWSPEELEISIFKKESRTRGPRPAPPPAQAPTSARARAALPEREAVAGGGVAALLPPAGARCL